VSGLYTLRQPLSYKAPMGIPSKHGPTFAIG
jgi:hypothetical protein